MTFKRFVAFSIALHCIILLAVYKIPKAEQKKTGPFTTTLVSPDVFARHAPIPPPVAPLPRPPQDTRPVPRRAVPEPRPFRTPARPDLKPLVPGEGDDALPPAPDKIRPGQGDGTGGKADKGASPKKRDDKPGLLGREGLFDRAVTEEIARKGDGSAKGRGKKDDAVTLDTNEYRFIGYNRLLRGKIESIWVYPPEAVARNIYGDLKIRFTIKKNGRLGAVELVRTSGYKMLDDAALKALKDGEPYWPLPDEWGQDSYTILGHFVYSMYGSYIR